MAPEYSVEFFEVKTTSGETLVREYVYNGTGSGIPVSFSKVNEKIQQGVTEFYIYY